MENCKKKLKLSLTEVENVLKGADISESQLNLAHSRGIISKEEIEEDTQIQSSIPFYFDHIFGTYLGLQPQNTPSPNNTPSHLHSSYETSPVLDSQGFLPERYCSKAIESAEDNHKYDACHTPYDISPVLSSPSTCDSLDLFPSPVLATSHGGARNSVETLLPNQNQTDIKARSVPPSIIKVTVSEDCIKLRVPEDSGQRSEERAPGLKRRRSMSTKLVDEVYGCPPSCTTLVECVTLNKIVNVLAIVIQVNLAMDVACRNGVMAGQTVSMASLLLADPTKSYFKLSLWREAAVWTERISIGDVVYFKSIRLKDWKNEIVGTTIMRSSVLNLHQPEKKLPSKVRLCIPDKPLSDLMKWGKEHYKYLFESQSIPKSQREVKFQTSRQLIGESLVHCRAKLLCLISSRVALLADQPGLNVYLHLLSSAAPQWHSQLSSGLGQVWEFTYVSVTHEETQSQNSICSLQTTSRTNLRMLSETCAISSEILKRIPSNGSSYENFVTSNISIIEIVSQRKSGLFEIKANATSMEFILPDASKLSLTSMLPLSPIEMVSKLCQAVYVGCEACSQALLKDENGVYCQCMPCIMKLPGGYPSSRYFFHPLMVILSDCKSTSIVVATSHLVVPKVLGVSAKDVLQASLSKNEGKVLSLQRLFSSALSLWVIRCLVTMDENSFIEELSFSLVHFHS